jgi:AraC-like DNA-binding protein
MPIFMDLHKASDFKVQPTVDDIMQYHAADLEVQQRLGVKIFQYWINEEAGLVFCLMEGPDKQSCLAVHRESHGNLACNIIELHGGDYMTFMGDEYKANKFDIVERNDGTLDTGYRIIMVADFISITDDDPFSENIHQIIKKWGGRYVNKPGNRELVVFTTGHSAIECALDIVRSAQSLAVKTNELRIGISAGEPVTARQQDIFADAIQLANHLCDIAQNNQIVISSLAKDLTREAELRGYKQESTLKILNPEEEQFLNLLIANITSLLSETSLNIDSLSKNLGISRSGLYRKITDLTGYSANSLIRELRMQKALKLIRNKYGNVAQVSLEVGIANPSFFAKSFQTRFGLSPSSALKLYS